MSVQDMTVSELFAIGNQQRAQNLQCGMSQYGVDYLTRSWIYALVEFQGLPAIVAGELLRRWKLDQWPVGSYE